MQLSAFVQPLTSSTRGTTLHGTTIIEIQLSTIAKLIEPCGFTPNVILLAIVRTMQPDCLARGGCLSRWACHSATHGGRVSKQNRATGTQGRVQGLREGFTQSTSKKYEKKMFSIGGLNWLQGHEPLWRFCNMQTTRKNPLHSCGLLGQQFSA